MMIALLASVAVACMCPEPTLDGAVERAAIIFVGKTRADTPSKLHAKMAQYRILQPLLGPETVEFEVAEVLKGKLDGGRVSVTVDAVHESCMQFEAGIGYLIFAVKHPKTGQYWVYPCGGTSIAKGSEAPIRELRKRR